jgi:hypothetical protein
MMPRLPERIAGSTILPDKKYNFVMLPREKLMFGHPSRYCPIIAKAF